MQSLYLKHRPKTLDEVVGNKGTIDSLKSILSRKDGIPHAILFSGPSGCGKTTLARIVKNVLDCSDINYFEMNVANVRGIDTIREIDQRCAYASFGGGIKIYLLDECHKLTHDAQNALLKLLEDTPSHVYFILCTTEPEKLIKTIRTRCTTYQVHSLAKHDVRTLLENVLEKENCLKAFPQQAIDEICRVADGSARQALVILDAVIDIADDNDLIDAVVNYAIDEKTTLDLCKALLEKQTWVKISTILKALLSKDSEEKDTDKAEKIRYAVLGYMSAVLLNKENDVAMTVIEEFSDSWMYLGRSGLVGACYEIFRRQNSK